MIRAYHKLTDRYDNGMTLILENLSLAWPEGPLLQDFSLSIAPGEIAVMQGPSGCGKSTLLSAIAGTAPDKLQISGQMRLGKERLNDMAPQHRHVGLLFQEALLFPHLTVAQNLAFGLPAGLARRARDEAIAQALADCELTGYGACDPAHLSGGQKARIAMMRAMLSAPKALMMDESFASLDPALRQQFGQFVATQIRKNNIPALLISHHEDDKAFATGQVISWPHL